MGRATKEKAVEHTLRMQVIAKAAAAGADYGEVAPIAARYGAVTPKSQTHQEAGDDKHFDAGVATSLAIAASLRVAATCADDLQIVTDGRRAAHDELAACIERLNSFEL